MKASVQIPFLNGYSKLSLVSGLERMQSERLVKRSLMSFDFVRVVVA